MNLTKLLQDSKDIKEKSGTTPFLDNKIKKAHNIVQGKCPRCRKGNVSYQEDKEGFGRAYYCNLCEWAGWLPFALINITDDDTVAYTLVTFYP